MPPAATEVAMEAARTKNFISEWVVWVVRWFEIGQWINVLPLWGTGMTRVKLILMLPSFFECALSTPKKFRTRPVSSFSERDA